MPLHELQERRAAKLAEARAIVAAAESAKRDLTEAEDSAFKAAEGEVAKLDEQIRRQRFLDDAERRMDGAPVDGSARDLGNISRRFSAAKALREHMAGKLTGAELEWQQENRSGRADALNIPTAIILGEHRAQLVSSIPAGGALVGTDIGPMIDRLKPTLAVEKLGATIYRNLTGFLTLPRLNSGATAYWISEHTDTTRSEAVFSEVNMSPKTVSAEMEISRRLMLQTDDVIEDVLRRDIAYTLSKALDSAAIAGSGVGPEPQGIIGDPSIPAGNILSLGAAGGAPLITTPADLMGVVEDANVSGNSGFLTNSKVRRTFAKLMDGNDRTYSDAEIWRGERVVFSNNVPSNYSEAASGAVLSAIIYSGNWADLVLGFWSGIDILANPYHEDVASKGGLLLHAFLDVDIALRHGESFAYTIEAITT